MSTMRTRFRFEVGLDRLPNLNNLAHMLSRFGLRPTVYRDGRGRKTKTRRGYLKVEVVKALSKV